MIAIQPRTGAQPLADYFRDVYCAARPIAPRNSTRENRLAAFSMLGRYLNRGPTLADLASEKVAAFLRWLIVCGRSPATANSYRNAILVLWRFAIERGDVDERPDLSIVREYRSYEVEAHHQAKQVDNEPEAVGPQMTLLGFAAEDAQARTLSRYETDQTRWAVMSLDRANPRAVRLDELTERLLNAWTRARLATGLGEATVKQQRSFVVRLWRAAFERGLVATPPPWIPGQRKPGSRRIIVPPPAPGDFAIGEEMKIGILISLFLDWQQGRIAPTRMHGTLIYLRDFDDSFGELTIGQLRPGACAKVDKWIRSHKGWVGCRASVVSRLKQLFNWGATGLRNSSGFYQSSPIVSLARPKDRKRVSFFTAEQVDAIMRNSPPCFAVAFRALLATGCRPNEVGKLQASDVEVLDGETYWMVHHKNERHTGDLRRIYLSNEAAEITRRQLQLYPTGRLFRSGDNANRGGDLSVTYLNHALRKVCRTPECRALGLDAHTTGERSNGTPVRLYRYVAYTARHTFAVRYLTGFYKDTEGKPIILGYPEVAQYLGNSASMVERIYGHLAEQRTFLNARMKGIPLSRIDQAAMGTYDAKSPAMADDSTVSDRQLEPSAARQLPSRRAERKQS